MVPELVHIVKQDGNLPDCAVAALAMLCGVTYGEALAAFPQPERVVKTGAYLTEMQEAAAQLDTPTKIKRRFNIAHETGVLYLSGKTENHVAFLWAGRVVDGDGACWLTPKAYLKSRGFKAKALLVIQS